MPGHNKDHLNCMRAWIRHILWQIYTCLACSLNIKKHSWQWSGLYDESLISLFHYQTQKFYKIIGTLKKLGGMWRKLSLNINYSFCRICSFRWKYTLYLVSTLGRELVSTARDFTAQLKHFIDPWIYSAWHFHSINNSVKIICIDTNE